MKKTVLLLLLLSTSPAFAQGSVEREPLKPFVPYTLQNETDPMALNAPPQDSGNTATPAPAPGFAPILSSDDMQQAPPAQQATPDYQASPPTPSPQQGDAQTYPPPITPVQHNEVSAVPREDLSRYENKIFCTLKISFGSFGTGIDRKTADDIKSYLDTNKNKLSYVETRQGKEGDMSYCVTVPQHRDQAEIYKDLRKMMPPAGSKSGPVTLSGKAFTPVSTMRYQTYRD